MAEGCSAPQLPWLRFAPKNYAFSAPYPPYRHYAQFSAAALRQPIGGSRWTASRGARAWGIPMSEGLALPPWSRPRRAIHSAISGVLRHNTNHVQRSRSPKTAQLAVACAPRSPNIIMATCYALITMTETHYRAWRHVRPDAENTQKRAVPPVIVCSPTALRAARRRLPSPQTPACASPGGWAASSDQQPRAASTCHMLCCTAREHAGSPKRLACSPLKSRAITRPLSMAREPPLPRPRRAATKKYASVLHLAVLHMPICALAHMPAQKEVRGWGVVAPSACLLELIDRCARLSRVCRQWLLRS